jgi:hypothetical protein
MLKLIFRLRAEPGVTYQLAGSYTHTCWGNPSLVGQYTNESLLSTLLSVSSAEFPPRLSFSMHIEHPVHIEHAVLVRDTGSW